MSKFTRNMSRRIYDPNTSVTSINLSDSFKQKVMKKIFMCKDSDSDFKCTYIICDNMHECVDLFKERYGFYPEVICLYNNHDDPVLIKDYGDEEEITERRLYRCRDNAGLQYKPGGIDVYVVCKNVHECIDIFKEKYGFDLEIIRLENDSNEEVLIK